MVEVDRRAFLRTLAASLAWSALPISIANALPPPGAVPALGCGEEFPFFGAHYPDAQCIDGYLWDLDSYDDGYLTFGGDFACPYCNARGFLDHFRDEVEERGWIAFSEGETPLDNPYLSGCRFPHLAEAFKDFWRAGYREAASDPGCIAERVALRLHPQDAVGSPPDSPKPAESVNAP